MFTSLLFLGLLLQCAYTQITDTSQCDCDCSTCFQNHDEIKEASEKYTAKANNREKDISIRSTVDSGVHKELLQQLKERIPLIEKKFTGRKQKEKRKPDAHKKKGVPATKKKTRKGKRKIKKYPHQNETEGSIPAKKVNTTQKVKKIQNPHKIKGLIDARKRHGGKPDEHKQGGSSADKKLLNGEKQNEGKYVKNVKDGLQPKEKSRTGKKETIPRKKNPIINKDKSVKSEETKTIEPVPSKTISNSTKGHVHNIKNLTDLGKHISELNKTLQNPEIKKHLNSTKTIENKISSKMSNTKLVNKPDLGTFTEKLQKDKPIKLLQFNKSQENYETTNLKNLNKTIKPKPSIEVSEMNNSVKIPHDIKKDFNEISKTEVRNSNSNNTTEVDPSLLVNISKEIAKAIMTEEKHMTDNHVTHERLRKARVQYAVVQTVKNLNNEIEKAGHSDSDRYAKRIKENVLKSELWKVMNDDDGVAARGWHTYKEDLAPITTDYIKLIMARNLN